MGLLKVDDQRSADPLQSCRLPTDAQFQEIRWGFKSLCSHLKSSLQRGDVIYDKVNGIMNGYARVVPLALKVASPASGSPVTVNP